MIITVLNYLTLALFLLLFTCTRQDSSSSRDNPFDANGTSWTIDSKPIITNQMDMLPLWYDYDFSENTGSIKCKAIVTDNNGKYDTVTTILVLRTMVGSLDTIHNIVDSEFVICHLKNDTRYYYSIIVHDKFDSSSFVSGSFITPRGIPPQLNDSVAVRSGNNGVSVYWYQPATNATYLVYRSMFATGKFPVLVDTMTASKYSNGVFNDNVNDDATYYYRIATRNEYGECKSKKILQGYKYSTSVPVPSSVYASQGSYQDYVRVQWYSSQNNATFFIHRSKSESGPFEIIDSIRGQKIYNDTVQESGVNYYYKVSVRDGLGRRSAPSSPAYGYINAILAPSNLKASQGTYYSSIALSWYNVADAVGYYVYRALSYNGNYQRIGIVPNSSYYSYTEQYYYDTVQTSDTYFYKVAAYTKTGKIGPQCNYVTGYLQRPTVSNVTVSRGTSVDYVQVSWISSNLKLKQYYIYRAHNDVAADSFKLIDSTRQSSYADSSIKDTDYYFYGVVLLDSNGRKNDLSYSTYGYIKNFGTPFISSVVQQASNRLAISWTAVESAKGYYLYRSNSASGIYEKIDSTSTTQCKDSSFKADSEIVGDVSYYYKVQAYLPSKKMGTISDFAIGTLKGLSYPLNIQASNNAYKSKIVLQWDTVENATGYVVYRSSIVNGLFVKIATVNKNLCTDSIISSPSYLFYYKVSSLKGTKESLPSAEVKGQLLIPPVLAKPVLATLSVLLTWTNSATVDTTIKGYYLYRSIDSITFTRIAVVNSYLTKNYTDSFLDSAIHYYKVASFSAFEISNFSNCVMAQQKPLTPTNFTVSTNKNKVTLTWDKVQNATSYQIYRGSSSKSLLAFDTVKAPLTRYIDSSINSNTIMYYAVASVNVAGESSMSTAMYANILVVPPDVPVNVTAVSGAEGILVTWNNLLLVNQDDCNVYRSSDSGKTYSNITPSNFFNTSYILDTVIKNQQYFYRISAINRIGESAKSVAVSGQRMVPVTPLGLRIGDAGGSTYIPVMWEKSIGSTGYNVYRSTLPNEGYSKVLQDNNLYYPDTNVVANTIYYYKIAAFNPIGESVLTPYVSAKLH